MRLTKLRNKMAELSVDAAAYAAEKAEALKNGVSIENIGELLFAAVAAARKADIDPEEALTAVSDEFLSQFGEYEKGTEAVLYK